jgi:hypothetical protein
MLNVINSLKHYNVGFTNIPKVIMENLKLYCIRQKIIIPAIVKTVDDIGAVLPQLFDTVHKHSSLKRK